MPFRTQRFIEQAETHLEGAVCNKVIQSSTCYTAAKTGIQKAKCVKHIMDVLDDEVNEQIRYDIMQSCGRQCIGASTLRKARKLKEQAANIDELLSLLNEHHIGGGYLYRTDQILHAAYDRCYCGSVNKTRESFSATYCHCSCGWYQKLFEEILDRSFEVELLGSIIQGDERCEFRIEILTEVL